MPGLSVSGDGRGCNTLTGRYVIWEVAYDGGGNVTNLAADFIQYCGGSTSPLHGSVRINSTVPVPVVAPNAIAGRDRNVLELNSIQLDGSLSTAGNGFTITDYAWTQVSGSAVTINNANTATPDFIAPDVAPGGETIVIELQVTNSNSVTATDQISLHVADRSDPRSYLAMVSQASDYIGQGTNHFYDTNDGIFSTTSATDTDEAHVRLDNGESWSLDFEAIEGSGLSVADYLNATRFPFNDVTVPGLDVSGDSRGCNTLTGSFNVIYISRDGGGLVDSFAADFKQHCGGDAAALLGRIRFNYVENSRSIPPFSYAGDDRSINMGDSESLNGSQSNDPDGSVVSYQWTQLSGTTVALSDATAAQPTFTVPAPAGYVAEDLVFELQVTDNSGDTDTDTVTLTINAVTAPIADAGSAQTIVMGTTASLDGSLSLDPNGTISSYQWTQLSGTAVSLSDSTAAQPTFTVPAPASYASEALVFQLQVTDNDGETGTATVTKTIATPTIPLARAGGDLNVVGESVVTLNGSRSVDADGSIVGYQWTQLSGPAVTLSDSTLAKATFTAPKVDTGSIETLVFELQVTDDVGNTAADSASVAVYATSGRVNTTSGSSKKGSGCSINKNAEFDPTFYIMLLVSIFHLVSKNRNVRNSALER